MAAFRTFRTLRKLMAPRWQTDGEGGLVGYALDIVKDAFVRRAELGLLAGFPQNGPNGETAPPDALVRMGQDRRVVRGINETDASYAYRLTQWLIDRRHAGSAFELMHQLAGYCGAGTSFRTVDVRGNWYSRSATGVETSSLNTGNWNWDDYVGTRRWARFWVVVYPGALWNTTTYHWGDGGLTWGQADLAWGSTTTPNEASTVRAIVNDWKPAGTVCVTVVLAFDGASFDPTTPEPDGTYGRWSKTVDGVRVPSRLSTARYQTGVRQ